MDIQDSDNIVCVVIIIVTGTEGSMMYFIVQPWTYRTAITLFVLSSLLLWVLRAV